MAFVDTDGIAQPKAIFSTFQGVQSLLEDQFVELRVRVVEFNLFPKDIGAQLVKMVNFYTIFPQAYALLLQNPPQIACQGDIEANQKDAFDPGMISSDLAAAVNKD